ncbi:hypothetical protein Rsub_06111 [Raphidocelis subcapitata]|uniref:DOT1 domain-containing protein n=1 Tax=Raphidocelis subcapitata TaxID=307507 RepID=A0A2V0P2H3_9CHLO|nr:hypothetical protein Rsub_06111 [Raphidocelis subcapitata]|eukprot:GBF93779.1 hypothetical protein Rsub_06111 [Raphidocelis subcapitata]
MEASAVQPGALDQLWRSMQRAENKVGGGEGVEGCYGTLTRAGVQRIMAELAASCGLGRDSVLVDIGAGIGRPLLHAMLHPRVAASWGVEIDPVKCSKGRAYIELVSRDMAGAGLMGDGAAPPSMVCVPVEQLSTLEPATHVYACWEGMPRTAKVALGGLFVAAATIQSVAVVQRAFRRSPLLEMREMGFGDLRLLTTFPVHLAGSQRQLNAYILVKEGADAAPAGGASEQQGTKQQQQQQQGLQGKGLGQQQQQQQESGGLQQKQRRGAKRGAAAAVAAAADDAASDASCDSALPLSVWLRVNGLAADAASSGATSRRERRKRRLS